MHEKKNTKLPVRNQGDSDRSSMVTNTGQTHAIFNTTELQVISEPSTTNATYTEQRPGA